MDLVFVALAFVPLEWVLCAFSIAFTVGHTTEEVIGDGGPFWCYYRRHFGRGIDDLLGVILFSELAAVLILLALGGYLCGSAFCLGALMGARLGDALLSHVFLKLEHAGPNPGVATTPLYLIEFAFVLAVIPASVSPLGFVLGALVFAVFWTASLLFKR
ncbi:hypothetical protein VT84_36945 [Gemmata sp. SH-PL17]|uniref:hypothetical protein n=1 Tax=Gemmata sp. SH-PL17 TaxID=1630693 RepID=UPI00078C85FB|nr:hypothetical protein [Gemmata sp. SH-PL17]AMV30040.1 hypothetical protein VT84_36945 [Gemmata sp. SH-PL17]